jgi:hypothetical protein
MGSKLAPGYSISADDTIYVFHGPGVTFDVCNSMFTTEGFASGLRKFGFTQLICTDDGKTRLVFDLSLASEPVGGKWRLTVVTDKMTDVKTEQFSLPADSEVEDLGLKSVLTLYILCSGAGHFNGAQLQTGVVLAVPIDAGSSFYDIRVRLDSKFSDQLWDRFQDGKTLGLGPGGFFGKRYLKGILKANDVRFQIPTFTGYSLVAQFSPAGLNREVLARSCGLK